MLFRSGSATIRQIRDIAPVRIIAMSGAGSASSYLKGAMLLGADAALAKPLKIDDLLGTVRSLIGTQR